MNDKRWTISIPIQVYDEQGNYVPANGETRTEMDRARRLEIKVWAPSPEAALRDIGRALRRATQHFVTG